MREVETDYLVVGAGASGMAFVDTLVAHSDAEVVLVDRRHRPGGHWLDAYPFVRLHQPSAYYGVESRPLGHDRIDEHGVNAGFYERASAAEICDYYARVLDESLLPTGRVRFFGMSNHRGGNGDGQLVVSLLDGSETVVRPRRKIVDATYVQSEIPLRHVPGFTVEPGVTLVPPNGLVDLGEPADRFTVIGAGKTAIDTCVWLLEAGVDPDRIRWIRGRDPWQFDRSFTQPLDLVGSYMRLQARWVEAAAAAEDGPDFARRLEDAGMFVRIDSSVEPLAFRGATVSLREIDALRTIEQVVRARRVRSIGRTTVTIDSGDVPGSPREVYVDCTAAGVPAAAPRPVFEPGRITIQYVGVGFLPWCAATIGFVESTGLDDEEKNRLCPPVVFSGDVADLARLAYAAMQGTVARVRHETIGPWNAVSRLNPARAASDHIDDAGEAAASPGWSGSASCTIVVAGPGYQHSETQRWQVAGPTTVRGSFRLVPSHWTDTGSGSSHQAQGNQTLDITWTVNAAAAGEFQFVVRASDKKLVIGQANAQLRVPNGITGTQRQTIGGVAQTPDPVGLEAFETQLPPIVVRATSHTVSGSMPPTRVTGSFAPFQPAAATVTKSCTWKFAKTRSR